MAGYSTQVRNQPTTDLTNQTAQTQTFALTRT